MQDDSQQSTKNPLDRNQKIAITVLAVFGFFLIIMWMIQFQRNLKSPFEPKNVTKEDEVASTSIDQLKNKDTDSDGLSDRDETDIYRTSPYLEDTDGDSIKDIDEIRKGKDPNCPEGKDCSGKIATSTLESDISTSTSSQIPSSTAANLNINGSTEDLEKMLAGKMDAATLRKTLLNSGMDPKVLEKLSDESLMNNYKEVLKNNGN